MTTTTAQENAMKFSRSPKAHGWYYGESPAGIGYIIAKGEFAWYVETGGAVVARGRTLKDAIAKANIHAAH